MSSHDFDFGCDFQSRVTGISAFMPPNPRFPLENKGQGVFLRRRLSNDLIFRLEIKVVRHEKGIARREML